MMVKQRTRRDCGLCCLAMLTARTYDDVLQTVGDAFDPKRGMRQEQVALQRLGFSHTFDKGRPTGDFVCLTRGILSPEYFLNMAWGRRSLVTVPSLNRAGSWHMIYYDGDRVLDPSVLKTYASFDQLRPDELVLFRE